MHGLTALIAMAAPLAAAASPSTTPARTVTAPGSAHQRPLAVEVMADRLLLRSSGQDTAVPLPEAARNKPASLRVAQLSPSRRVVHVVVTLGRHRAWEALVAGGLGAAAPRVIFSGFTGFAEGDPGERQGAVVEVSPGSPATILVGREYETFSLCGRPAMLSPRLLVAKDLVLRGAKLQRLSADERAKAPRLKAIRRDAEAPPVGGRMFRAVSASSAVGAPGALTDGDPATTWAEGRGGDGRGEIVLLRSPEALPMNGVELEVRPPTGEVPHGVGPRELWLATEGALFHVTFPEDPWKVPGARWLVEFPQATEARCLAVVMESSHGDGPADRVTLTELRVRTPLSGSSDEELVASLAKGGIVAKHAGELLRARGNGALAALARAYRKLPPEGRRIALDVMDQASCPVAAPVYVEAMLGGPAELARHGEDFLRQRCRKQAGPVLLKNLKRTRGDEQRELLQVLADLDPALTVRRLTPLLARKSASLRARLREAIGRAAQRPAAASAVRQALTSLAPRARLDLLRALEPVMARHRRPAVAGFGSLASRKDFRTRYLLAGPAGALVAYSPGARRFLDALLKDPDPALRFAGVQALPPTGPSLPRFIAALEDDNVRVRREAVVQLGDLRSSTATAPLLGRLDGDPWPLVRIAAGRALAVMPPDGAIDDGLAQAIADRSAPVRIVALEGIGRRRATAHVAAVRRRLADGGEKISVRAQAALVLGQLCDRSSLGTLTDHARRLADPFSGDQRAIGIGALRALGWLQPPDLRTRLAPLLDEKAPRPVRFAARAALRGPGRCRPTTTVARR